VFDNVRVPVENLIGEENKGWTYAKVLLTHERTGMGRVPYTSRRIGELKTAAAARADGEGGSLLDDPIFAQKVAEVEIDLLALEYAELRTLAAVAVGKAPGPESSILKIVGTEVAQQVDELFLEVAGYDALPFVPQQFQPDFAGEPIGQGSLASASLHYLNHRKATIYGGSNEIQKNIICKAVLGL